MTDEKTKRIAELNDRFRSLGGMPLLNPRIRGRLCMTAGIAALPLEDQVSIWTKVQNYDDFSAGNDPYGEHDFGAFDYNGQKIFWKIDYYAAGMKRGSEDPADPDQTIRVLTIMLAEEY